MAALAATLLLGGTQGALLSRAAAPEAPFFPAVAGRDPGVPSFEGTMGYAPGERLTGHDAAASYLRALDTASDRALLETYGVTHEGRTLHYLVVSDPRHIARLDEIKAASQRLADPRALTSQKLDAITGSQPAIVWIAAAVHGNESSSTEAVLALAWHLVSARDPGVESLLRDVVVVLDPAQNPDGRERFVQYQRQTASAVPRTDAQAAEHDEAWPSGRYNHMLFDLNRDWFFLTQPETRGRVAAFLRWMPQVFVDLHEMGSESTYYFAPPAEPVNRNVAPQIRKWWDIFGRANAAAFDREGFDYFTAESYDGYYPGYGDSWPSLHGAIGMTYEQASPRGLAVRRKDGTIVTLREAARHHLISCLTTLDTAARHRQGILRDHAEARREAVAEGSGSSARVWLAPPTVPTTAARLASLLLDQGIEVSRAEEEFSCRAQGYDRGEPRTRRFPAGTFLVSAAQPAGRLVTALMEIDPFLAEEFIGEELERRRLKEDSGIYDITAWSLPVVLGAEAYWTTDFPRVRSAAVARGDMAPPGGVVPLAPNAEAASGRAGYAYLIPYNGNASLKAMIALLREGLRVQAAGRPFRIGAEWFPAGSLVLKVRGNPESLHEAVKRAAAAAGVTARAVASGLTDEGIDLGSLSVRTVPLPAVAVATGEPVSPTSVGAVFHLFETVYGLPFTPVRAASLPAADLSRYDVLVLPDEKGPPGYKGYFSGEGLEALQRWVEEGGTLITLGRASSFAARKEMSLTATRRLLKPVKGSGEEESPPASRAGTSGRAREGVGSDEDAEGDAPERVPGAILKILLEPSRPLAFGYGKEGAVLVNNDLVFTAGPEARLAAAFGPRDRLRIAGFAHQESLDLLAGSPYVLEETRGRGRVILFADDPNFRGAFEALHRMFFNAVLTAPVFGG